MFSFTWSEVNMVDTLLRWVNSLRGRVHSLSASVPSEVEHSLRLLSQKTRRVASLLRAGLSPAQALTFAHLDVRTTPTSSAPTPQALIAELWTFALESGAAPARVLEVCADAFAAAAENARQARVHLAGPQAATNLVMTLPLVALAGGFLTGYNPLSFLLGTALGWIVLASAALLTFLAHRWSRRMVRQAQTWEWSRGMAAEVMALSLTAGHSVSHAHALASDVARRYVVNADLAQSEITQCDELAALARHTGVGLAGLLRSQAQSERDHSREEAQMQVEKLSVRLMIPLGVCVLPAFIAVGVLPLVASVISSTALNS